MASFLCIARELMPRLQFTSNIIKKLAMPTIRVHSRFISTKKSITSAAAASVFSYASSDSFTCNRGIIGHNGQSKPLEMLHQRPHYRRFSSLQSLASKQVYHKMTMTMSERNISLKVLTKNMNLYSSEPCKASIDESTLELKGGASKNPLVLLMAWLMAKEKHIRKYAQIYTDMGFDVLAVQLTPWQLLWPVKGAQVVAAETIKFLDRNKAYSPIVLHGFSVGAYQFGEILIQLARDTERYAELLDRFVCQIWDSAADITEVPVGMPISIFPRNPRMQSVLRNYIYYHLKTFHNQTTVHYMRSSQIFHATLIKKPTLIFCSENDLIGPPSSNTTLRESLERANIKVTYKCWEKSMHVAHMMQHREEYMSLLLKHLEDVGVLESLRMKSQAKL